MIDLLNEPAAVVVVILLVSIFIVCFGWEYFRKGLMVSNDVKKAIRNLKEFSGDKTNKIKMEENFIHSKSLLHCWKEYSETLHPQINYFDGETKAVRLRSTVPAEAFFSYLSIVDTELHIDFFKHLPGILTGIGIIGTFFGLIAGLQGFDAGGSAEDLRQKLGILLNGVKSAFIASTVAIGVAILVTILEKWLLNNCYGWLAELVREIDSLYEAGAGEEYLARLVDSSEENSVQTRHLKDSLVNDLKDILATLTDSITMSFDSSLGHHVDRQMAHQHDAHLELSNALGKAVSDSLRSPMEEISRATRAIGGNQGDAISDLLAAMIDKVENTFGGQMKGLGDLMAGNAEAMRSVQTRFTELADRLSTTGESTTAVVAAQMQALMVEAEQRQRTMNDAILSVLDQIRGSVRDSQDESARKLAESMAGITASVDAMMRGMAEQRLAMGEAGKASMAELQTGLSGLIAELRRSSSETSSMYSEEFKRLITGVADGQQALSAEMTRQLALMARRTEELDAARQAGDARRQEQLGRETDTLVDRLTGAMTELTGLFGTLVNETAAKRSAIDEAGAAAMAELRTGYGEFIREVRNSATDTGAQYGEELRKILGAAAQGQRTFGEEASRQLHALRISLEEMDARRIEAESGRQERQNREINGVFERISTDMRALTTQVGESVAAIRISVDRLQQVSVLGSESLERGAGAVRQAATDMSTAGVHVTAVLDRGVDIHANIASTSKALVEATQLMRGVVEGYVRQRQQIEDLVGTLQNLVSDTDARVGVSRELVADMERLVGKVRELQVEAHQYLGAVSEVIHHGFEDFTEAVKVTMVKVRAEFDTDLSKAVSMFSSQVTDLDDAMGLLIQAANVRAVS